MQLGFKKSRWYLARVYRATMAPCLPQTFWSYLKISLNSQYLSPDYFTDIGPDASDETVTYANTFLFIGRAEIRARE
jgi:hypothetical protein